MRYQWEEQPKKKRISGYDRMKRKNQYLAGNLGELNGDVAALEALVEKLLGNLEILVGRNVTDKDVERVRRMVGGIRAALATEDAGEPDLLTPPAARHIAT
jgi:hypothetical protein